MKLSTETLPLSEGQVIALNSRLKDRAKTDFNFAVIDQIKGSTIDATFIDDAEVAGRTVHRLDTQELNLQFYFVYPDIRF
jgi:hypothetical protein